MPRDNFEGCVHKIRPDDYGEPEKKITFGCDNRVYQAAPFRMMDGQKTLKITYADLGRVFRVSKAGGLTVDASMTFDRTLVRDMGKAIRAAETRAPEIFDEPTRAVADRFLAFLERDGACGFFLTREFR